jgi:hypothetical protein
VLTWIPYLAKLSGNLNQKADIPYSRRQISYGLGFVFHVLCCRELDGMMNAEENKPPNYLPEL